jgi:2-oxoglutarate dehydrogenase complex dehydrogenase (E1) component-like enzyme
MLVPVRVQELLFKEFSEAHVDLEAYSKTVTTPGDFSSSGDVKYHLGTAFTRVYPDDRKLHMTLLANPSHLETVDPVVAGKIRAKQDAYVSSYPCVNRAENLLYQLIFLTYRCMCVFAVSWVQLLAN